MFRIHLLISNILQALELPLNASSWTEEDLKDPKKLYEMTILLNAQREIADKILDSQWEAKWREEKVSQFLIALLKFWTHLADDSLFQLNEMLKQKVEPYLQNINTTPLPNPIVLQSKQNNDQKVGIPYLLHLGHTPSNPF